MASGTPLVDPSGKVAVLWGPVGKTLARIDIASGTISTVTAKIAATTADPVADLAHAIGRWIAPPVAAKVFIDPGLVLSPDGTRIFALAADTGNGEAVSSQGVFVFDGATLEQVAHWPPTADTHLDSRSARTARGCTRPVSQGSIRVARRPGIRLRSPSIRRPTAASA